MASKLTKKNTKEIAELAKLELTSDEIDKFTPQLSAVVDLINELSKVETDDTAPTAQTTNLENVLREDVVNVTKYLPQDGSFEVPQILHNDETT